MTLEVLREGIAGRFGMLHKALLLSCGLGVDERGGVWGQAQGNGGLAGPFPLVRGRPIGQEPPVTVKIVTAAPQGGNPPQAYTMHTPTTGGGGYPVLSNAPLPASSCVPPLNLSAPTASQPVCPPPTPPHLLFSLPSSGRLYLV